MHLRLEPLLLHVQYNHHQPRSKVRLVLKKRGIGGAHSSRTREIIYKILRAKAQKVQGTPQCCSIPICSKKARYSWGAQTAGEGTVVRVRKNLLVYLWQFAILNPIIGGKNNWCVRYAPKAYYTMPPTKQLFWPKRAVFANLYRGLLCKI